MERLQLGGKKQCRKGAMMIFSGVIIQTLLWVPKSIYKKASQKFYFTFSLYLPVLPIGAEMCQATCFQAHIASAVIKLV